MRDACHGSFPGYCGYDWYDWNLLDDGFEPGRLFDFGYWFGFVIPALRVVLLGFLALDLDMDCLGW